MPFVFALKGSNTKTIHGAHARGPLEIRGHFTAQGPQPIGEEGGCPQWVADLLEKHPDIQKVALSGDNGGVVWSRIADKTK